MARVRFVERDETAALAMPTRARFFAGMPMFGKRTADKNP
jgi:hypothetical protein